MNIPENISQHLKFISENGDLFAGILKGEKKEFLHHPFWNFDQIENSLRDKRRMEYRRIYDSLLR